VQLDVTLPEALLLLLHPTNCQQQPCRLISRHQACITCRAQSRQQSEVAPVEHPCSGPDWLCLPGAAQLHQTQNSCPWQAPQRLLPSHCRGAAHTADRWASCVQLSLAETRKAACRAADCAVLKSWVQEHANHARESFAQATR